MISFKTLYLVIKAVITASPQITALEGLLLDALLKETFQQVLNCVDQQLSSKNVSPVTLLAINKNQNELLRCYAELAIRYSDRILPFLLQKLEQNNEMNRVSSLIILKHLIN